MISGIEYFMVARVTSLSQVFFDGTMIPFSSLIFALGMLTVVLYTLAGLKEKSYNS